MLYELRDATISVGGETVLTHVDFEIKGTEKIAVVGRNGAGKTTLLRVLAGELAVDRDDRRTGPAVQTARRLRVELLSQQVFEDEERTVEEELLRGYQGKNTTLSVNDEDGFQKNILRQKEDGTDSDAGEFSAYERERFLYEYEYDRLLTGFGFAKEDKKRKLSAFSGGQRTKLALIRLLLAEPDVLLLDEPTNHLDMQAVEWLESCLRDYKKAVVMVSHDRFFLDQVAEIVYEVTNHSLVRYVGNYTSYKQEKQKSMLRQQKRYEQQMAERKRLEELIERFKHKPNKAAMARAKKKQLERMEVPEPVFLETGISFRDPITPLVPGAKWVYEAEHLKVGYERPLFETSLRIRRGQKIAVLGANGTGKTALLKTVAGIIPPLQGKSTIGNQILMGYFDQKSGEITSEKTVLEYFGELFPALTEKELRRILAAWLFDGRMAGRPVSALSGGEKARLELARILQSKPNFCVLDEPTNHMDIPAKEVLEAAFSAYTGTLLFVSHDRYFISKVADALLLLQDGEVYYYPFGYAHYLERSRTQPREVPLAGQMKAEDAALLASLKAVPKREYFQLRDEPTETAFRDWQLRLAEEELEGERERFEKTLLTSADISAWEEAEQRFCEACLRWYDRYLEITE